MLLMTVQAEHQSGSASRLPWPQTAQPPTATITACMISQHEDQSLAVPSWMLKQNNKPDDARVRQRHANNSVPVQLYSLSHFPLRQEMGQLAPGHLEPVSHHWRQLCPEFRLGSPGQRLGSGTVFPSLLDAVGTSTKPLLHGLCAM